MPFLKVRMRQKVYAVTVAFIVIAAFASLLMGATVPESVPLGKFVRVKLDAGEKAIVLSQDFSPVDIVSTPDSLAFTGLPGRYVVVVLKGDEQPQQFFTAITGTVPPPTPDPKPDPKPDDPPTPPPTPTDVVTPAPIPEPGLRVLMVYESLDAPPKVPKPQYDAMFDGNVRDWMTANCAVGPTNVAEWRMIDKDDLFIGEEQPHWKNAAMRPRRSLPWVLISNGTTNRGYEGPVPADSDKFLELLKRFK